MTRIHKRPSVPITHSGSISVVIPLVESLNKSLTPCLVTEHHLKSNNETRSAKKCYLLNTREPELLYSWETIPAVPLRTADGVHFCSNATQDDTF